MAGLTLPDRGQPVPTRVLAGALTEVSADSTFLRRSFWVDTAGHDLRVAVPRIVEACVAARRRSPAQAQAELAELRAAVELPLVAQPA